MRYLKMFLVGFGGLFLLLFVFGMLIPSKVKISRGVIVAQPIEVVYDALNDVKTWSHWMPWVKYDSTAVITYSQNSMGPGAYFSWQSHHPQNEGRLQIISSTPSEIQILYTLKNEKPAKGGFRIEKNEKEADGVQVIWFMEYRLAWYPWERFYGIFADKVWGGLFESGLNEFKNYLESFNTQAMATRENLFCP